jgi:outer membrane scaffolding protein for murein synthesis (MipA/OmpV family)
MLFFQRISLAIVALSFSNVLPAGAQESGGGGFLDWIHGDWYLKVGAAGFVAPRFEGDDSYVFNVAPLISLGKAGPEARFSSRNDNVSLALIDNDGFRAGVAGKLLFERDDGASNDVEGLDPVRFGGELGGFAEVYPTDWLRLRGEVRHGIRSHNGIVADVAVDAFTDVTPTVRVSAGPRLSVASQNYFDAYYGVTPQESVASGLSPYAPGGGMRAAGVGGAVTWATTDRLTTSAFGEYARLLGPAADSSLVKERGSPNQFLVGVSATYRFDFQL